MRAPALSKYLDRVIERKAGGVHNIPCVCAFKIKIIINKCRDHDMGTTHMLYTYSLTAAAIFFFFLLATVTRSYYNINNIIYVLLWYICINTYLHRSSTRVHTYALIIIIYVSRTRLPERATRDVATSDGFIVLQRRQLRRPHDWRCRSQNI